VTWSESSHGDESSADAITLLIHSPHEGTESRDIYEWQGSGLRVWYHRNATSLQLFATAYHSPIIFLLRGLKITASSVIYNDGGVELLQEVTRGPECLKSLAKLGKGFCIGEPHMGEVFIRGGATENGLHIVMHNVL
jgi:hypothetical protein